MLYPHGDGDVIFDMSRTCDIKKMEREIKHVKEILSDLNVRKMSIEDDVT